MKPTPKSLRAEARFWARDTDDTYYLRQALQAAEKANRLEMSRWRRVIPTIAFTTAAVTGSLIVQLILR